MSKEQLKKAALDLHKNYQGKIATHIKVPVKTMDDLSLAYSPGVAEPCREIFKDKTKVFDYTNRGNTVAIISNGTAVLGLGNIGPEAGIPVMEGKALLFKKFADIDGVSVCLNTKSKEEVVEVCCALEPNYGGINLEDIASPDCVYIERKLEKRLSIPVFHDDQHGTAIVCAAALINALKLQGRDISELKVVMSGMGAAGSAIARLLRLLGVKTIYGYKGSGIVFSEQEHHPVIRELFDENIIDCPSHTNATDLAHLMEGADVFIGVSVANVVTKEMVRSMNPNPIIFAMANPDPEIMPEDALEAGAAVVGTGRMDYPNQINNVLAFPGLFRGALEAQKIRVKQGLPTRITREMRLAAVYALAGAVPEEELSPTNILPSPLDTRAVEIVSKAVFEKAMEQ